MKNTPWWQAEGKKHVFVRLKTFPHLLFWPFFPLRHPTLHPILNYTLERADIGVSKYSECIMRLCCQMWIIGLCVLWLKVFWNNPPHLLFPSLRSLLFPVCCELFFFAAAPANKSSIRTGHESTEATTRKSSCFAFNFYTGFLLLGDKIQNIFFTDQQWMNQWHCLTAAPLHNTWQM